MVEGAVSGLMEENANDSDFPCVPAESREQAIKERQGSLAITKLIFLYEPRLD